jgi:ankyrin repeat protein
MLSNDINNKYLDSDKEKMEYYDKENMECSDKENMECSDEENMQDSDKENMQIAIRSGKIMVLNFYVEKYGTEIITENEFLMACENGDLNMLEYMININSKINISYLEELALRLACKYNYIDIINFLLDINPNINLSIRNEEVFLIAFDNNNIDILKLLTTINPMIKKSRYLNYNISITEHCFINSCSRGNFELMKWLLEYDPEINISVLNEKAFERCCYSGNLKIVKYLLELKPDINVRIYNDEIFIFTTLIGHIHVSDYLIKYCKNLFNKKNIHKILKSISENGKYEIMNWLFEKDEILNMELDFKIYCEICISHNNNKHAILILDKIDKIDLYNIFIYCCVYANEEMTNYIINKNENICDKLDNNTYNLIFSSINDIEDLKYKNNLKNIQKYILSIKPELGNQYCFFCF